MTTRREGQIPVRCQQAKLFIILKKDMVEYENKSTRIIQTYIE